MVVNNTFGQCNELIHWPLEDFDKVLVTWFLAWFILVIDGWDIAHEISSRWMSLDFTDDKSTLVQVMAWCRQATSHYLNQCWPRSLAPYGVTRPQWINTGQCNGCDHWLLWWLWLSSVVSVLTVTINAGLRMVVITTGPLFTKLTDAFPLSVVKSQML